MGYSALQLTHSPTAYWRLSSTADASGNGHTLTPQNAPSQAAASLLVGDADPATLFVAASNQYLTAAHHASLSASGDFTLISLVKPTAVQATNRTLISKGAMQYHLRLDTSNRLTFDIATVVDAIVTSAALAAATTYHGAVTRSGNDFVMYINGVSVATATDATATNPANTEIVRLGSFDGTNFPGNHTQDETAIIINTALSAGQVAALYTQSIAPTSAHRKRKLIFLTRKQVRKIFTRGRS